MENGLKDGVVIVAAADAGAGHRVLSRAVGVIVPHPTIPGRLTATVAYAVEEVIGGRPYKHMIDVKSWADSNATLGPDEIAAMIAARSDKILSRTMSHIQKN